MILKSFCFLNTVDQWGGGERWHLDIAMHLQSKGYDVIILDNMSYGNEDNLKIDGETFGTFIEDDVRNKTIFDYTRDVD